MHKPGASIGENGLMTMQKEKFRLLKAQQSRRCTMLSNVLRGTTCRVLRSNVHGGRRCRLLSKVHRGGG